MRTFLAAFAILALVACGQAAAPTEADAQTGGAAPSAEVTAAERSAILAAMQMTADAQGQVENECGDRVTPQYIAADLGAGVGRAVAFVVGGGQSTAACYGDGPLVMIYRNAGGSWRQIYMRRGGMAVILSTTHNGANDIADGGPGFSFPVWEWNGNEYVFANREVADSALGDARFIPN